MGAPDGSAWPTARAEDAESCGNDPGATDSLTGVSRNWGTPRVTTNGGHPTERTGRGSRLEDQVVGLWATPRTITGGGESAERKQELGRVESGGGDLQAQTEHWPTPNANPDAPNNSKVREGGRVANRNTDQCLTSVASSLSSRLDLPTGDGPTSSQPSPGPLLPSHKRKLSALFVEWLMGIPVGWTSKTARIDSGDLAIWFARSRQLLLSCCSRGALKEAYEIDEENDGR